MGQIYIAYRRDDAAALSGRVADRLRALFGSRAVMKDVDGTQVEGGAAAAVRQCSAVVVLIGPRWLTGVLASPGDQTYAEIATGLSQGIPVIPVLVHGASLPDARLLPPPLAPFMTRGYTVLGAEATFDRDIATLAATLRRFTPPGGYQPRRQARGRRGPALPGEAGAQARRAALGRRGLLIALVVATVIAACGGGSLLLSRRFATARAFNLPEGAALMDIANPPGTDDAWAVGGNYDVCVILHYTAGAWTRVSCPIRTGLNSVSFVNSGEGWAVGGDYDRCNLLHFQAGSWSPVACPIAKLDINPLVRMDSHGAGWIVSGPVVLRYTNGAWAAYKGVTPGGFGIGPLAVSGEGVTWGWTDDGFMQAVGGVWTSVNTPALLSNFFCASIDFSRRDSAGWAVGDAGLGQRRAYIAEYINGVWLPYPQQPSVSPLRLVKVGLFGDVWATGGVDDKGGAMPAGLIMRYDGHTWTVQGDPASGAILGITDVADGDAWAVAYNGHGTALLWYHGGYWRMYFANG